MNLAEKILVITDPEISYNLCEGGKGAFSFINKNISYEKRVEIANKAVAAYKKLNKEWFSNRSKKAHISRKKNNPNSYLNIHNKRFLGKKHKVETIEKMKKSKNVGNNNSQFGTCWINDGIFNKKIKKECLDDYVKNGYVKGRILIKDNKGKFLFKGKQCQ